MTLSVQIVVAFILDIIFGDPKCLVHPVTIVARFAKLVERVTRRLFTNEYIAGGVTCAVAVLIPSSLVLIALLALEGMSHVLALIFSIYIMYAAVATHDLARHALAVKKALDCGNLEKARGGVGMIVGRDTDKLSEEDIVRATIESVGENMVDGVTAPIMYMLAFGPVGVVLFKCASTMDSLFGYRNERYGKFGYCSAKLDDILTYIPARLTVLSSVITAALLCRNPIDVLRITWRDGRLHESPNSAYGESCLASVVGLSLGGEAIYNGKKVLRARIGDGAFASKPNDIFIAVRAMVLTSFVTLVIGLLIRMGEV